MPVNTTKGILISICASENNELVVVSDGLLSLSDVHLRVRMFMLQSQFFALKMCLYDFIILSCDFILFIFYISCTIAMLNKDYQN